jgi:WD40 repeat protein
VWETALNEEVTEHLGHAKNRAPAGWESTNVRNGTRSKTVISDAVGDVVINVSVVGPQRPRPTPPTRRPLTGHTSSVWGAAFSPDGHTLATGSDDRTIRVWDLPRLEAFHGDEVREACLRAGRPLDKATWDQYTPGLGYQDTCADH